MSTKQTARETALKFLEEDYAEIATERDRYVRLLRRRTDPEQQACCKLIVDGLEEILYRMELRIQELMYEV